MQYSAVRKHKVEKCRKNLKQSIRERNSKFNFDEASVPRWLMHKKAALIHKKAPTCTAHSRAHTQQTTLVPVALLQHIAGSYSDLYFVGKLGTRSSTSEAMRSPQRTESAKTAHTQRNMFNDGDNETINLSLLTVSSLGTSQRTWPFTQSSSIHVRISLE